MSVETVFWAILTLFIALIILFTPGCAAYNRTYPSVNARYPIGTYNTIKEPYQQPGYGTHTPAGEYLRVQPDAYGLGTGMDQFGRPVKTIPGY